MSHKSDAQCVWCLGSYNYFHCNHRHNDSHIISEIMTQPHVTKPVTTLSRVRQPIIIACARSPDFTPNQTWIFPILCFRYYIYRMSELWLRATSWSRLRPANKRWSRETGTSEAALVFCSRPRTAGGSFTAGLAAAERLFTSRSSWVSSSVVHTWLYTHPTSRQCR